jgi:trans-aconitate methyltransferase
MKKLTFLESLKNWNRKLRWNKQYKSGKWNYLFEKEEEARYVAIIKAIREYANNPKLLDLGTGEGVLRFKLQEDKTKLQYYCGIDFSKVSIEKANKFKFNNSKFVVADLHYYTPDQNYDVIVFNEAFYYINNKLKSVVLDRVLSHLKDGGVLIVSIFKEGEGCWEFFNRPNLEQLEFRKIESSKENRYWKLGVYKKRTEVKN